MNTDMLEGVSVGSTEQVQTWQEIEFNPIDLEYYGMKPLPNEVRTLFCGNTLERLIGSLTEQSHVDEGHPVEAGAFLIGTPIVSSEGRRTVLVQDFMPISDELSERSGAQFTIQPEAWRQAQHLLESKENGNQMIVGWAHTHPGFGTFLSEQDMFVTRNYFMSDFHLTMVFDPIRYQRERRITPQNLGIYAPRSASPAYPTDGDIVRLSGLSSGTVEIGDFYEELEDDIVIKFDDLVKEPARSSRNEATVLPHDDEPIPQAQVSKKIPVRKGPSVSEKSVARNPAGAQLHQKITRTLKQDTKVDPQLVLEPSREAQRAAVLTLIEGGCIIYLVNNSVVIFSYENGQVIAQSVHSGKVDTIVLEHGLGSLRFDGSYYMIRPQALYVIDMILRQ